MTSTRVRTGLKQLATVAALLTTLGGLAACSDDSGSGNGGNGDERPRAEKTADDAKSDSEQESPTASTGEYDLIALENYTYTLDRSCQCRDYGRVEVTVEGGEAVSAVFIDDLLGVNPGDDAPKDFLISINDILAQANDPEMELVHVGWPPRQEFPRAVFVDPDEGEPNNETFYQIYDVTPAG